MRHPSRRELLKAGLAGAIALALPAVCGAAAPVDTRLADWPRVTSATPGRPPASARSTRSRTSPASRPCRTAFSTSGWIAR